MTISEFIRRIQDVTKRRPTQDQIDRANRIFEMIEREQNEEDKEDKQSAMTLP